MKDCKKIRKLYRVKILKNMYCRYQELSMLYDIDKKYNTFQSYRRGFFRTNTIKLAKRHRFLFFIIKGINNI